MNSLSQHPIIKLANYIRLSNLLLTVICMFVLRQVYIQTVLPPLKLAPALNLVWFSCYVTVLLAIMICGYWINDYFDRSADAVNRPGRMLVSTEFSDKAFWGWWIGIFTLGFCLAGLLAFQRHHIDKLWLYPASVMLLTVYSAWLKKSPLFGNILVAGMVGLLPWLIYLSEKFVLSHPLLSMTRGYHEWMSFTWRTSLLLFLVSFARELVKALEDESGDRAAGYATVSISFGGGITRWLAVLSLMAVFAVEVWYAQGSQKVEVYISSGLLVLFGMFTMLRVFRSRDKLGYRFASLALKILLGLGIIQIISDHLVRWH